MPICPAFTKNGTPCASVGRYFEHHCKTHHNSKLKSDVQYKARFDARWPHGATDLEMINANYEEQLQREAEAQAERMRVAAEARRTNKITRNARVLTEVPDFSPMKILSTCKRLITLWRNERVPNYECPKAYAILSYTSPRHPHYVQLLTAVVKITQLANGYHPDHDRYADVPLAEKTAAHDELHRALEHWVDQHLDDILPAHDPNTVPVRERRQAEEEAVAAEARRVQLQQDLRERPVVFKRDPEGSIDLKAFATDQQSVHRSSVQKETEKGIQILLARPIANGQSTLEEIIEDFRNWEIVQWMGPNRGQMKREAAITEITNDYFTVVAFNTPYAEVCDRVWTYIRGSEHRKELTVRLAQEVYDGIAQCTNGKMARLINTLLGFDKDLVTAPPRELLHGRMSVLSKQPKGEREAAARILFVEFEVPVEEQAAWLEPLMEAD
jgi:hypothetical protein